MTLIDVSENVAYKKKHVGNQSPIIFKLNEKKEIETNCTECEKEIAKVFLLLFNGTIF